MSNYGETFINSFYGYFNYLLNEILWRNPNPWYQNYFYLLLAVSLLFFLLEIAFPWRKNQPVFRRDFWLDFFYMFFNFFLISLIAYAAISNVAVQFFYDLFAAAGITNYAVIEIATWPLWLKITVAFVLKDFIQWNTHRLLHRYTWLWNFHKVHHSAKQMGFATHLRFHFMEKFIYNSIQYFPLAILGFGLEEYFIAHLIAIFWGHFNHANINVPLGPFKYIFNNPQMHVWHHAKVIPNKYGVNFGLTLSVWDYLFKTAYEPHDGKDIELGFEGDEDYQKGFIDQNIRPFTKKA